MKLQRLLVVIDPNRDSQPALQRAAWLARHNPAQLHLLLVDYHAGLDGRLFDSAIQAKGRAALLEQHGQWLEQRIAPLRSGGLEVQVDIRWGKRLDKEVLAKVADRKGTRAVAEAYLQFLYSDIGQDLAGKHFYRPRSEKAAAKYANQFAKVNLITIDEVFGGWAKAQKTHFADGGVFDQIFEAKR